MSRPHRSILRRTTPLVILLGAVAGMAGLTVARGNDDEADSSDPMVVRAGEPNPINFPPERARFVRFVIHASAGGQPALDELEIYGPDGTRNLALSAQGAIASASSCISGYAIHRVDHLNDGRYGNDFSWIAATDHEEWAQIELPAEADVVKLVFSRDRRGNYQDRLPVHFEVRVSRDGHDWKTVAEETRTPFSPAGQVPNAATTRIALPRPLTWDGLLVYSFLCERATWNRLPEDDALSPSHTDHPALPDGAPYWKAIAELDSTARVLRQMGDLIDRLAAKGLDVPAERAELATLVEKQGTLKSGGTREEKADRALYLAARLAKRRLFFRDPDLAALERVVFIKRHPYTPSHNYSDILDSAFRPGGGVCVLEIPRSEGRLDPAQGTVRVLFDATNGIARDAVADFDAARIYFAYRPSDRGEENAYWHVMEMNTDGSGLHALTSGPFHDYYPCPLPDGGIGFISTRCRTRFLCWRPQAFVLFRMDADGQNITPLSHANLSEWAPSVQGDGRILWTRSEYLDKGADFGHTLWAIHPDGSHPSLLFGNNTLNCYVHAREVPGTSELCCTIISHGGDLNGPIGLVDLRRGPFGSRALTNITPDVRPQYHMTWAQAECFRDPVPVSRDHILVSHAPSDRFGLYVIDRFGNREVLYLDPTIGSMSPSPLRPVPRPPVLGHLDMAASDDASLGQFLVADVYRGLEPTVKRGTVKYVRVCQEVRSDLEQLPDGSYRKDHEPFQDFYASPTHKLTGPNGWPSYVAKASLGLAPVEADGSANFYAPAGKVLYLEVLDENFNELQRMRSVVQLQAGERRSCVGCHESRTSAPPVHPATALRREPSRLQPPPWGAVAFSYEKVVQPVWDAKCVACHDRQDRQGIDLSGTLDVEHIPASYRTLITRGLVHYFDYTWGQEHREAAPMTFGTVRSPLWAMLDAGHHGVQLDPDETHRVKCWIDLNVPLWPDYRFRADRPVAGTTVSRVSP